MNIINDKACLIEINSETDFVSRNEQFKIYDDCSKIANYKWRLRIVNQDLNSDNTVEGKLTKNVATIGENLNIRRIEKLIWINWHNCLLCT